MSHYFDLLSFTKRRSSDLMELTIGLPCVVLRPASMTSHFDESIIRGTREMSGSAAMSLVKRSIASTPSIIPCVPLMIDRSEEHTSELQSHVNLVCRLLLE